MRRARAYCGNFTLGFIAGLIGTMVPIILIRVVIDPRVYIRAPNILAALLIYSFIYGVIAAVAGLVMGARGEKDIKNIHRRARVDESKRN